MDTDFLKKVKALPMRQQIALWVILKKFHKKGGTWFTVPEFGDAAGKFFKADSPVEKARMMGGIMSSLLRNGMVDQLSGGRQPVWQVVPELHKHAEKYQQAIFPVTTYWEAD